MLFSPSLLLSGALAFGCHAQPPERLEFEAASIKPLPPYDGRPMMIGCQGGPGTNDPVLFICQNFSLSNMVNLAYAVGPNGLSAPDWMGTTRFDLSARLEKGTTYEQFMIMFQNLLADRFKLVVHRENRERTGYQLVVAKDGPKFKAAAPPEPPVLAEESSASRDARPFTRDSNGFPIFARGHHGTSMSGTHARMYEPAFTMDQLAFLMSMLLHEPVANATGLDGSYEISVYWILDSLSAAPSQNDAVDSSASGPTLLQAVQQQLGLRVVRSQKVPFEMLVVDRAEKQPSSN